MFRSSEDFYTADRDLVDSIKMEASSVSPKTQEIYQKEATKIVGVISDEYSKYISADAKKKVENVHERVVVLDQESYSRLMDAWLNINYGPNYGANANYFSVGEIICMQDMDKRAEDIYKNSLKGFKVDMNYEDIEKVFRKSLQYTLISSSLVHELVHTHQAQIDTDDISELMDNEALSEYGTAYITKKIMEKYYPNLHKVSLSYSMYSEKRVSIFENILEKYGNDAFYVFFNNKPENMSEKSYNQLRDSIYGEFDADILIDTGIIKEEYRDVYDENKYI